MEELTIPPSYYGKSGRSRVIRINKDHPFYRTSNKGNISEPRLIMATHLGRNLTRDNIVYHKDDDNSNNEIGNLVVLTRREFATVRDWRRLKKARERISSKISIYEQYMADAGIDPTTLTKDSPDDRYREVDRDREAYDRSRHYGGGVEE